MSFVEILHNLSSNEFVREMIAKHSGYCEKDNIVSTNIVGKDTLSKSEYLALVVANGSYPGTMIVSSHWIVTYVKDYLSEEQCEEIVKNLDLTHFERSLLGV